MSLSVCINVKYLKKNIGVLLTVTWDGNAVFSKEVSGVWQQTISVYSDSECVCIYHRILNFLNSSFAVRNPPAICLNVPLLKKLAKLCVQLYNMDVGKDGLSGCSRITIKVAFIKVIKLDLGCFRIPFAENEIEGKELADLSQLLRKYEAGERPLSVPMMYLIKVFRVQLKPLSWFSPRTKRIRWEQDNPQKYILLTWTIICLYTISLLSIEDP